MQAVIGAFLIGSALCCLTVVGGAWAQTTWVDEISSSLAFSTANFPAQTGNPISDVAVDELYNFSLMVTSIQEYGIAVPAGLVGLGETSY